MRTIFIRQNNRLTGHMYVGEHINFVGIAESCGGSISLEIVANNSNVISEFGIKDRKTAIKCVQAMSTILTDPGYDDTSHIVDLDNGRKYIVHCEDDTEEGFNEKA